MEDEQIEAVLLACILVAGIVLVTLVISSF